LRERDRTSRKLGRCSNSKEMQGRLLPSERWRKSSNLENNKNNLNLNQSIVHKQIILARNKKLNFKQIIITIRKLELVKFLNLAKFRQIKLCNL
jgi:hypothetical protein